MNLIWPLKSRHNRAFVILSHVALVLVPSLGPQPTEEQTMNSSKRPKFLLFGISALSVDQISCRIYTQRYPFYSFTHSFLLASISRMIGDDPQGTARLWLSWSTGRTCSLFSGWRCAFPCTRSSTFSGTCAQNSPHPNNHHQRQIH